MANRRSTHHHEGITDLALQAMPLPVLLPATKEQREGTIPMHGREEFADSWDKDVRTIPGHALQSFVDPGERAAFEKSFGAVDEKERARILYLLGIANAVHREDKAAVAQSVAGFTKLVKMGEWFSSRAVRSPARELGEQLNICIREAIFVIWWSDTDHRFLPGLYCKDLFTAIGALALNKIGRPGGLSVCQRPQCGQPFIQSRGKQNYCSPQCQAAAAMTRYRARKKKGRRKKKRTSKSARGEKR